MKSKFPGAVPEIPVRDINEAAAYYESNLGFTVDWGGEELGLGNRKGKLPGVFGELGLSKGIRQHWASVDLAESGKQRGS
jgi:hypothetical protein